MSNEMTNIDSGISLLTDEERAKRLEKPEQKEHPSIEHKKFVLGQVAQMILVARNIDNCPWSCYGRGYIGLNQQNEPIVCRCVVDAMARTGGMRKHDNAAQDSGQGEAQTPAGVSDAPKTENDPLQES